MYSPFFQLSQGTSKLLEENQPVNNLKAVGNALLGVTQNISDFVVW